MNFYKKYIKKFLKIRIDTIMPTIFITFSILLLLFNPFKNIEVTSFNRQIGRGLLFNVDISQRISNMINYNFVFAPILFLITLFIINLIFNISIKLDTNFEEIRIGNIFKCKDCIKFINAISIVGIAPLIFGYINRFADWKANIIPVLVSFILIAAFLGYIILNICGLKLNYRLFKWSIFSSLPLTYLIGICGNELYGNISLLKILFIYILIVLILVFLTSILYKFINLNLLIKVYTLIMIAPLLVTIVNEVCNILTQYSIIINSKIEIMFIIYILLFFISVITYFIIKSNENFKKEFRFENWYYPIIILTLAIISTQLPYQSLVSSDFFERANHGLAINSLLKYWSIPIVENFDAHMLQNQIGSIIYGLFNNDAIGAIFLKYSISPIILLTYYFMFKKFFNTDYSLLIILFFPIEAEQTFTIFPLAPFVILTFLYAYKNKNYKSYLVFWISIAISALYRLDMGFAIAMASIITWILMWLFNKERVSIRILSLTCIYVVVACLIIFSLMCICKHINPMQRILEVLRIIESNVNWGYDSIGSPEKVSFVINYFIVPISVVFVMGILIYKKQKLKMSILDNNFIICSILGFIFIFNYSRGIVRHSLVEGTNAFIISTYILFIGFAIAIIKNKNRELVFILTSISVFIILNISMSNNNINEKTLIFNSIQKYNLFEPYNTNYKDGEKRFIIHDSMINVYEPLKEVLDYILKDSESYIDFTNQTLLYALIDRKNPVYINQSPGLLSGETLQQTFIEQCEKKREQLPIVLMPLGNGVLAQGMDGILNSYRYYLVMEYIGINYEPLFKNSNFAIWCRKDRLEGMKELLNSYLNSDAKYKSEITWINYNYLDEIYHTHELQWLPYIWAKYDKISLDKKEKQLSLNNTNLDEVLYDFNNIDKKSGNYLYINASSNTDQILSIKFGKNINGNVEELNEFLISIKAGENQDYLIRISGDFMWYSNEINCINICNNNEITINNLSILKGDTLK